MQDKKKTMLKLFFNHYLQSGDHGLSQVFLLPLF